MSELKLESVRYGAERIGVKMVRFHALIRSGIFPPGVIVRLGRQIRVHPGKLEAFIEGGGQALPGGWRWESDEDRQPSVFRAHH